MLERDLVARLARVTGAAGVVSHPDALRVYDCDGYTLDRAAPELVVLPRTPEEVAAVVRVLAAAGVSFVPRGAGTGLSGGTLPVGSARAGCRRSSRSTAPTAGSWPKPGS
jgi:glycolate oxidase